jgi:hypothetical protein
MATLDELLLDPTPEEVARALGKARSAANRGLREHRVEKDADFWTRFARRIRRRPEGRQKWAGSKRGTPVAEVSAAWWTDHLGRCHVRVIGERVEQWREHRDRMLRSSPLPAWPLWRVHPERVLVRTAAGRDELLAVCPCGMVGTPAALGWTGERCGPCHDRAQEGDEDPGLPFALRSDKGPVDFLAFAANGRLVSGGLDDLGEVRAWDPASGASEPVRLGRHGWIDRFALSPGGTLAVAGARSLRLVDVSTGTVQRVALPSTFTYSLAFSPDGRFLAGGGHRSFLLDVSSPGATVRPLLPGRPVFWVGFSPGGQALFALDNHSALWSVDPTSGEAREAWAVAAPGSDPDLFEGDNPTLALSPDGRWLALPHLWNEPRTLRLGHLPTLEWLPAVPCTFDITQLAFAPDGRHLILIDRRGDVRVWDLSPILERAAFHLQPSTWEGEDMPLAFSPDGEVLAVGARAGVIRLLPWRRLLEG